ncbi:biliverdin-producing heme oxygenase [Paucibacter sp. PLA-PC-4]|uniref:biliverdin-producing heme oxygenase n=1 Tax=Paucibacter sp. PLA-PC-4 TaxID=2993655 RepID=UPI00224A6BC9|nr:biliverdin-producing heme oxygenase [Paucibacter sp. PLA-PC-4]MCX2864576.1 biliverdin-producing heme oxygenase [Paucibacter sp. PLA-PC-4]
MGASISTASNGLAARLKDATRDLHRQAERSGVMAELMQGRISRDVYCLMLRNLQPIYAALEVGLDAHNHADPSVQRLWRPELRRLPALEQDLDYLHAGADWRRDLPMLRAAAEYAERLERLARTDAVLLIAHAYLRYLGDLHGGQMLARIVRQGLGLKGELGTAFYAFGGGDAQKLEQLKLGFRVGLDALTLTPEQADAIVDEACEGFRLHASLFESVQGDGRLG